MKRIQAITITVLAFIQVFAVSAQTFEKPDPSIWYRLTTRYTGTDLRKGRCIQYFPVGSEHPDMLWSADTVSQDNLSFDYQLWAFIPSLDNPDRYKMVCKAASDGFVNPTPTSDGQDARWKYETSDNYSTINPYKFLFVTSETLSGVDDDGVSYCAIATEQTINEYYNIMNCGGARQGYAINLWNEDYSEEANEWLFRFEGKHTDIPTGLENIATDAVEEAPIYYDLFGRIIEHPTKGVYICQGKKILVR